jgi:hypothetical protein
MRKGNVSSTLIWPWFSEHTKRSSRENTLVKTLVSLRKTAGEDPYNDSWDNIGFAH